MLEPQPQFQQYKHTWIFTFHKACRRQPTILRWTPMRKLSKSSNDLARLSTLPPTLLPTTLELREWEGDSPPPCEAQWEGEGLGEEASLGGCVVSCGGWPLGMRDGEGEGEEEVLLPTCSVNTKWWTCVCITRDWFEAGDITDKDLDHNRLVAESWYEICKRITAAKSSDNDPFIFDYLKAFKRCANQTNNLFMHSHTHARAHTHTHINTHRNIIMQAHTHRQTCMHTYL